VLPSSALFTFDFLPLGKFGSMVFDCEDAEDEIIDKLSGQPRLSVIKPSLLFQ
jgi:hypothetical protein